MRVVFALPVNGVSGGTHSIMQEADGMRVEGVDVKIVVPSDALDLFRRHYEETPADLFAALTDVKSHPDVAIATVAHSWPLAKVFHADKVGYYVQGYEPLLYADSSRARRIAEASYTQFPDGFLFAKTQWLCDIVVRNHDIAVHKVEPSLDHTIFHARGRRPNAAVNVCAMIRPWTACRAPRETWDTLRTIKRRFGDNVQINVFGYDVGTLPHDYPRDFKFVEHGYMHRRGTADFLREQDVFCDFSTWQGFGRTGLEAMASGCAVILPHATGTTEYGRDMENALMIDTSDQKQRETAVMTLVKNAELRAELVDGGISTARCYSIKKAVASELELFECALRNEL